MKKSIAAIWTIASLVVVAQSAAAAVVSKQKWTPLDQASLTSLYAGKTWRWAHGAAYFGPAGQFKAWTRSKGVVTQAFGTWDVRPEGIMCFSASWQASADQTTASPKVETCFSHSANGREIAQMKEPDGKWYVFKHAKVRKEDEFLKLRPGDHTHLSGG